MWRKTFTVTTALPPSEAVNWVAQLLEAERVRVEREEAGVRSVRAQLLLIVVI